MRVLLFAPLAMALQAETPAFYSFTHPDGAWSIDDINGNIATFGEFADRNAADFHGALKRDGDAVALREFETIFKAR